MQTAINLSCFSKTVSQPDLIPLAAEAGFEGAFIDDSREVDIIATARALRRAGLFVQSVHAPYTETNLLWEEGEEGEAALAGLIGCAQKTAEAGAPIMVSHVFIGFGEQRPNALGVDRFGRLLKEAEALGITVAFENTEGEAYLERVFADLGEERATGFVIDTGHEMCYNRSRDLITRYGKRLCMTHVNDNMGITGDDITWLDDSHLLPFDGVADWPGVMRRLHSTGFAGPLTLELTIANKPDRHTHDRYAGMDPLAFLTEAHARALRLAAL